MNAFEFIILIVLVLCVSAVIAFACWCEYKISRDKITREDQIYLTLSRVEDKQDELLQLISGFLPD